MGGLVEGSSPTFQHERVRVVSHFDRDPYHYDLDTFRWICRGTGLRPEHLREWGHPRDQHMLLFVKR
jgi:hypothetical protein